MSIPNAQILAPKHYFSQKGMQDSLEKWLVPSQEQGKYKMIPEVA